MIALSRAVTASIVLLLFIVNPDIYFEGAIITPVIESLATETSICGSEVTFEGIDYLADGSMTLCSTAADYIKEINTFPIKM